LFCLEFVIYRLTVIRNLITCLLLFSVNGFANLNVMDVVPSEVRNESDRLHGRNTVIVQSCSGEVIRD